MTDDAQILYEKLQSDTALLKYTAQMTMPGPLGFWSNEQYTTIDLTHSLISLKAKAVPIYGIYGQDDGLYSKEQIKELESIIENVQYLDNCSHSVFIDQQYEFINTLISISKVD